MYSMENPKYAGFWIRFLAIILDTLILSVPSFFLQIFLVQVTGLISLSFVIVIAFVVLIIYLDGIKGGTPGKLILGLRIVNVNGEYIGISSAIKRMIGKFFSGLLLGIGYLMIAWDKKKQGLHDSVAKSFVIYK